MKREFRDGLYLWSWVVVPVLLAMVLLAMGGCTTITKPAPKHEASLRSIPYTRYPQSACMGLGALYQVIEADGSVSLTCKVITR